MAINIDYGPAVVRDWCPTIDVRCVGPGTFEARAAHGYYSAVGLSREEAVTNLRARLPAHIEPVVQFIPDPKPASEYNLAAPRGGGDTAD